MIRRRWLWSAIAAGVLAAAALFVALRRGPADNLELTRLPPVERVGAFPLGAAELERYVRAETGLTADDLDSQVRARLAEELLAEALLARGAERANLSLDRAALGREIARLQRLFGVGAAAAVELDARRRVLARQYVQQVLALGISVPSEQVDSALRAESEPSAAEEVVFRQLRLESREAATAAQRRLAAGEPFERLAREISTAPDKGRLQRRDLGQLPPAAAAALRTAAPGATTRAVAVEGAYYLFQLDARFGVGESRGTDREEVESRLWRLAFERRRQQRLVELARLEGVRAPASGGPEEELHR